MMINVGARFFSSLISSWVMVALLGLGDKDEIKRRRQSTEKEKVKHVVLEKCHSFY